jgi:hypothetical protein
MRLSGYAKGEAITNELVDMRSQDMLLHVKSVPIVDLLCSTGRKGALSQWAVAGLSSHLSMDMRPSRKTFLKHSFLNNPCA